MMYDNCKNCVSHVVDSVHDDEGNVLFNVFRLAQ